MLSSLRRPSRLSSPAFSCSSCRSLEPTSPRRPSPYVLVHTFAPRLLPAVLHCGQALVVPPLSPDPGPDATQLSDPLPTINALTEVNRRPCLTPVVSLSECRLYTITAIVALCAVVCLLSLSDCYYDHSVQAHSASLWRETIELRHARCSVVADIAETRASFTLMH